MQLNRNDLSWLFRNPMANRQPLTLLFRHDPIGIACDNENTDEYDPETGTTLLRLRNCESASDVLRVVHEEFVRCFDAVNAGPVKRYAEIASEVWRLWQPHR